MRLYYDLLNIIDQLEASEHMTEHQVENVYYLSLITGYEPEQENQVIYFDKDTIHKMREHIHHRIQEQKDIQRLSEYVH